MYHCDTVPVSYTHLDVYKRQWLQYNSIYQHFSNRDMKRASQSRFRRRPRSVQLRRCLGQPYFSVHEQVSQVGISSNTGSHVDSRTVLNLKPKNQNREMVLRVFGGRITGSGMVSRGGIFWKSCLGGSFPSLITSSSTLLLNWYTCHLTTLPSCS